MAIVNKAIDVIKTLWPQRAIRPSMLTPPVNLKMVQPGSGYTSWATYMGASPWSSTSAQVMTKTAEFRENQRLERSNE
jgi:hypothetical protein